MSKLCITCKNTKSDAEFYRDLASKDGLQSACKECGKLRARKSYRDSPERQKRFAEFSKQSKRECLVFIDSIKRENKCAICDENHESCLDFHHIDPTIKEGSVSRLAGKKNRKLVVEEIKKCVILCSNCHRKFHAGVITLIIKPIYIDNGLLNNFLKRKIRSDKKNID